MTIVPTTRPSIPSLARPAPATPVSQAGSGTAIDPVKMLKKHKWLLAGAAAAGVVVGAVAHYVMLRVYPIFRSQLTYECYAPEMEIKGIRPIAPSKDEMEKFMATQVQVILSDRIVDKTVNDPALERDAPKWTRQFKRRGDVIDTAKAAKELRKKLSAGVAGQSQFISVSLWGNDPLEVTAIVKLLGRTYEKDRRMVGNAEIAERKDLIAKAIADTTDQISKRQRERQRIISDAEADALTEQVTSVNKELDKTQGELVGVRAELTAIKALRDQYEDELKSQMGPRIDDDIRDQVEKEETVHDLKNLVNLLESEMHAMKARLGDKHPDYRRLTSRMDGAKQQLDLERERLNMQAFYARLERYRSTARSMEAQEGTLLRTGEDLRKRAVELAQILAQVNDIKREIDSLSDSRARLAEDLKNLEVLVSTASQATRVLLFQDAQVPKIVSFPRLVIMVPAGAFLFLALTAGVVLLVEVIDQRVKSPADIAMIPKTRVLGIVPHASEDPQSPAKIETVFRDQPGGVLAESFRQLRGAVLKRMSSGGHKSLVCMSGMPNSGATSIAVNLAYSLAAAEQRVLLIDANFRRPGHHRVLGLSEGPGLSDVLAGAQTLAGGIQKSGVEGLDVLCAGSPEHRLYERLTSSAMTTLLKDAGAKYDLILFDVAPAMVAGDAMGLANKCDASMLVVRALGEKRGMVARLRNELSESRAEFLGVVVNAVRASAGGYLKGNIQAAHTYQLGANGGAEDKA